MLIHSKYTEPCKTLDDPFGSMPEGNTVCWCAHMRAEEWGRDGVGVIREGLGA